LVAGIIDEPFGMLTAEEAASVSARSLASVRATIGWGRWWDAQQLTPTEAEVFYAIAGEYEGTLDELVHTARSLSR
jgi:hypothetical protein